tara:strand:+ start:246 stop:398 length:153 start_codon:yes stop_codon:yes gene_type:complete
MRTILLGEFNKQDTNILTQVINDHLIEMGVKPASFAFHIAVDVDEEINDE